jgi:hypothetical protein
MNDQAITILLFIISVVLTVLLAVLGWVFVVWNQGAKKRTDLLEKQDERLDAIEKQMLTLDFKVTPMWAKVQKSISTDLHQPHQKYAETDKLLEQLEALTISPQGRIRLKELLEERSVDMSKDVTESERTSAQIMSVVMDKVLSEQEASEELVKIELVGEVGPTEEK